MVSDCKREMKSVMREEESTEWKVRALTCSLDHFSNMRMLPITTKSATMFTRKPLENFKLSVPTAEQIGTTPPIVWVTRNSSKHVLLVKRATHAQEMAQEIPAVCRGCCNASLFVPLARRVLASEPLDEVKVPPDGCKLHHISLAPFCSLCRVLPSYPIVPSSFR